MENVAFREPKGSTRRAGHVCINCRLRKKRCDKRLPGCTYCAARSLVCYYIPPSPAPKQGQRTPTQKSSPVYNSPITDCFLPAAENGHTIQRSCSEINSSVLADSILLPIGTISKLQSTDNVIHLEVCRILQEAGQFADDIGSKFFGRIHKWIPILSRKRFHNSLVNFPSQPGADFSILLLTMCLITYQDLNNPDSHIMRESIYLGAKMLYARVQAFIPASVHLIQAGILLSEYEYATGRPDVAYMTIGSCARMGYSSRINETVNMNTMEAEDYSLAAEEERNLWWGVVICERTFSCDVKCSKLPFAATLPCVDSVLPSDIDLPGLDTPGTERAQTEARPLLTEIAPGDVGAFVRQAQAAYLVEEALEALKMTDKEGRMRMISALDIELQSFLSIVMDQCPKICGPFCAPAVLSLRALFMLHEAVLSQTASERLSLDWEKRSLSTLETATKIVIDIAHIHTSKMTIADCDHLPSSWIYLMRAALSYLERIRSESVEPNSEHDALKLSLSRIIQRWGTR
ncbi:hypothetical protein V1525DRAFT_74376 [Lipomyces kononenkoae]|uniref:Uncharacterized protein n=1 Tax=Lipomyces kononenkoae TaxID=34357 RepID=A0ACC3SS34_LIPKO